MAVFESHHSDPPFQPRRIVGVFVITLDSREQSSDISTIMNSISVAASVLGTAGKASRALDRVSNLRYDPDQLFTLINEV